MDNDPSPIVSEAPPLQSLRQKLRAKLILWGILAPPGVREAGLIEEEQVVRRRMFLRWRRHPGGR